MGDACGTLVGEGGKVIQRFGSENWRKETIWKI